MPHLISKCCGAEVFEREIVIAGFGDALQINCSNCGKPCKCETSTPPEAMKETLTETEKAFGGCKNCYGKGYHTVKTIAIGRNYYQELDPIHFCKCSRGQQLKEVIARKEAEAYKRGREDREKEIIDILDWRNRKDGVTFNDGDDVVDWIDEKINALKN